MILNIEKPIKPNPENTIKVGTNGNFSLFCTSEMKAGEEDVLVFIPKTSEPVLIFALTEEVERFKPGLKVVVAFGEGVELDVGVGDAVLRVKEIVSEVGVGVLTGESVGLGVGAARLSVTGKPFESPLVGDILLPLNLLKTNK